MASYTLWQGVGTALQLALRAEAIARTREPGPQGEPGEKGADGAPGRDGDDGRGWAARGSYEPTESYRGGDVVWRDMSPFLALSDDPGPCEEGNENWQLVVARASRGQQGKAGDRGPSGSPGAPAPRPIGLKALPDYMAQLVLDDGTISEPFSVRAWFEQYDAEARR
jgi:hypothetical protein